MDALFQAMVHHTATNDSIGIYLGKHLLGQSETGLQAEPLITTVQPEVLKRILTNQLHLAKSGNAAMAIWLAKNYLGFSPYDA
jgi:hypothetical protein